MTNTPCLARIRGLPNYPNVAEINARTGPGTNYDIPFKGKVGLDDLPILDVQIDAEGKNLDGKVYQWFHLKFPDGTSAWIRDDLLDIKGACGEWGYGESIYPPETFAFALKRDDAVQTSIEETPEKIITPPESIEPTPALILKASAQTATTTIHIERVKKAAFAVTATFEGSGYGAYNNYDAGIISYGLIQFTLAAGSLNGVIERYLKWSNSSTANELRAYADRIRNRDESLRHDENLKRILLTAANEAEMKQAQDEVATINYWDKVIEGYIVQRELKLPLTYALLFDMGVNFGTNHGFVRLAEEQLGVPKRSKPGENGISEEQLVTRIAELRKQSHDRQAERDNLPGLRVRGDFWMNLISTGDWGFMGDANGNAIVNGRKIQIGFPK